MTASHLNKPSMLTRPTLKSFRRPLIYLAVVVLLLETLAPLAWMFISSISEGQELLSSPPHWIPDTPTLYRYDSILLEGRTSFRGLEVESPAAAFLKGMANSVIVALSTTLACLIIGVPAAYAIARFRIRGKNALLLGLMSLQMLPAIATVIPMFYIIRFLGLEDSKTSLIITYSGFTVIYIVWVMTGYIRSLPVELEEAARLDGCTNLGALLRIVLPIALPGMVAVGILSFLTAWNEFLFALVLTHSSAAKTLPVMVSEFSTQFGVDYGMMMTGGFLASLPPVILAVAFQRHLVGGLAAGSVKG